MRKDDMHNSIRVHSVWLWCHFGSSDSVPGPPARLVAVARSLLCDAAGEAGRRSGLPRLRRGRLRLPRDCFRCDQKKGAPGPRKEGGRDCLDCGAWVFAGQETCFRRDRKTGGGRPRQEINWECTDCGALVFAGQATCLRCDRAGDVASPAFATWTPGFRAASAATASRTRASTTRRLSSSSWSLQSLCPSPMWRAVASGRRSRKRLAGEEAGACGAGAREEKEEEQQIQKQEGGRRRIRRSMRHKYN